MNIEKVRCFIPVGGQARRLRPITSAVSKPCVRLMNRSLIEYSLVTLAKQGIRNFIFGERGYTNYTNLFDQYGDGTGFSAKYNIEPRVHIKHQPNLDDLGSADSYRLNMKYYNINDMVLVVQGDNLFEINLNEFIQQHEKNNALMSIALAEVPTVEGYGIADLDNDMRIQRFIEKPQEQKLPRNLANAGLYLLSPQIRTIIESPEIQHLTKERSRLDFGYDLIPYLVEQNFPVYGYKLEMWHDVGDPERYLKAMHDILYGTRARTLFEMREKSLIPKQNIWVQGTSDESVLRQKEILKQCIKEKLSLTGAVLIGRHTRIGDYTRISDSSIDHFCILGEHVTIENSAVMDASTVSDYATISRSIIGRKVIIESTLEAPTLIEPTSVIGNAVHIRKGCKLVNTKVNPGLSIPPGMIYINKVLKNYEDIVRFAE